MTANSRRQVNVLLDKETHTRLSRRALEVDRSVSWIVRKAIQEHLASPGEKFGTNQTDRLTEKV